MKYRLVFYITKFILGDSLRADQIDLNKSKHIYLNKKDIKHHIWKLV